MIILILVLNNSDLIDLSKFFYIDGPGGTGKTFLYNTILAYYRANNKQVIAVASSGIAATLLDGGITAHSKFRIPIAIHEDSVCNFSLQSPEAQYLKEIDLILWDEAPMAHKHCFEAVDRFFKDLMRTVDPNLATVPFGGKKFVIGGDFRQTLPVVLRGTKADIINATIKSSNLWRHVQPLFLTQNMRLADVENTNFRNFIMDIGNGTAHTETINNISDLITLPDNIHIPLSMENLFNRVYDNFIEQYNNPAYINQRAVLAALNKEADVFNNFILDKIPGMATKYLSIDYIDESDYQTNFYTPEYLNTLNFSGLPPHELSLKLNQPVILMRNISKNKGLCNGTRLLVKGSFNIFFIIIISKFL